MSSGGSSSPSQTVVQSQQIPQYEQDFSQNNLNLANSLQGSPYPNYQGALVAPFTDMQNQGLSAVSGAANAYQPFMSGAGATIAAAGNPQILGAPNPASALNMPGQVQGPSAQTALNAYSGWNQPGVAKGYINPYVQQSLNPQLSVMQQQLQQQQNNIGMQAAGDNAFGDARHGVAQSLAAQNSDLQMANLIGQGYNTAYSQGIGAHAQDVQNQLSSVAGANSIYGTQEGALQGAFGLAQQGGQNEQQILGNLAGQTANLGAMNQQLGLQGANAMFGAGAQQQGLTQQELNTAYQQYQNQVNWPYQMLSVGESALSNNPYTVSNTMSVPNPNPLMSGLGAFASLAGGTGGLQSAFGGTPQRLQ
jgi:hypothetical protein